MGGSTALILLPLLGACFIGYNINVYSVRACLPFAGVYEVPRLFDYSHTYVNDYIVYRPSFSNMPIAIATALPPLTLAVAGLLLLFDPSFILWVPFCCCCLVK